MRHAPAPLLAAALVATAGLAACGQPFLSARVEIPEIRIVQPPEEFPPVSIDPTAACSILQAANCSGQTFSFDIGDELDEEGVATDLRLTYLALHLTGGDARGIRRAEVDLMDPDTGVTTVVASYVRGSAAGPLTEVVARTANEDLSRFLTAGKLDARVEVLMDPVFLPTGFTASLEAAFSVKVTVDYRKL